jgi:putative flippase GtrA
MVVQLGGMAINSAVIRLGVDIEHWWYPAVQVGAIVLTTIWSYVGQKFWAFQGPRR